ncbi:MAG: META domain-containing protein [Moheibacter sp.]
MHGKPINGNPENYYLIFNSEKGNLNAKANCNTMTMQYVIENRYKLTIGDGISTLMACPDSNDESNLVKALKQADNISIGDGILTLNKGRMTPLAKFKKAE